MFGGYQNWLVVSNIWIIFHNIWHVILPIDELHHFSRWVVLPATSIYSHDIYSLAVIDGLSHDFMPFGYQKNHHFRVRDCQAIRTEASNSKNVFKAEEVIGATMGVGNLDLCLGSISKEYCYCKICKRLIETTKIYVNWSEVIPGLRLQHGSSLSPDEIREYDHSPELPLTLRVNHFLNNVFQTPICQGLCALRY